MTAATRIKNNQITDLTVNAAAKLQDYSVTSAKIANNLTYGSDLTVTGNLTVQGNVTSIDTHDLVVEDPLIALAKDQSGSPSLDIGFIGRRGTSDNIAWIWDESADEFAAVYTTDYLTNTTVSINSYASIHAADITANNIAMNGVLTVNVIRSDDSSLVVIEDGISANSLVVTGNVDANNVNATELVTGNTATFLGDVYIGGNIDAANSIFQGLSGIFYGDDPTGNNAIYAGVTGYTLLGSDHVAQFTGNVNAYSQINFQNINAGNQASTDYVATADNGDDDNYYVNLGINSSTFDDPAYPGYYPSDAYLHNHGGNLIINPESANTVIKFMVGGESDSDVVGVVNTEGIIVTGNVTADNVLVNSAVVSDTVTANTITGGNIWSSGNIQGANLVANAGVYTNTVSATSITATGNIQAAGIVSDTILANTITAVVEVIGANVTANNTVFSDNISSNTASVLGNITGGNIISNAAIIGSTLEITNDALISGNLVVQGNLTYINIDDLRVEDPVIVLGTGPNGNVLVTNDGKDRGAQLDYYNTGLAQQQSAFLGWINTSGNMLLASNVTVANDVVTVVEYGTVEAGNLWIETAIASGNIVAANVNANALVSAVTVTASGNVNGNNVVSTNDVTTATVTASGNVDGLRFKSTNTTLQAPTVGDYAGERLTLYNFNNVAKTNYAIGVETSAIWHGVDTNLEGQGFKWYGNTTEIARLSGVGNLVLAGNLQANANIVAVNITGSGNVAGNNVVSTNDVTTATVTASGNVLAANVNANALVSAVTVTASGNVNGNNVVSTNDVTTATVTASGNVLAANVNANSWVTATDIDATGNITGNILEANTQANIGNIVISGNDITSTGSEVVINDAQDDIDFRVESDTNQYMLYVDAGSEIVLVGGANAVTDVTFRVDSTDSQMVPVGNTAQRPSAPVAGMQRFNTTLSDLEFYDGTAWFGTKFQYTVIRADSFTGDGSTVTFVLSEDTTTAATMVSINGVVQIPTTAYSVSGNVLTFTEPPDTADHVDARILTTTATVTSLQNTPGNASVICDPLVANVDITAAETSVSGNLTVDGTINGTVVFSVMGFEKTTDVTGAGNVTFDTTPYFQQGIQFGNMSAGGDFTFSSAGVYQVNVAYNVSADPDGWGGINGFSGTRYNQARFTSEASGVKSSAVDIISVSANDTYTWKVNNAVTVYGSGTTKTRIQFMRIG